MEFVLSPTQRLELFVPPTHTVTVIKEEIAAQTQLKYAITLDPQRGFDLKLPGAPFITDGNMKLASLPYVVSCQHRGRTPTFLVLDKRSDIAREYKNENVTIGAIIGHSLGWTLKDEEITEFRQSTAKQRYDNYISAQRGNLSSPTFNDLAANASMGGVGRNESRNRLQSTLPTMLTSTGAKKGSQAVAQSVSSNNLMASSNEGTGAKATGPSKILIKMRYANGTFSTVAVNLLTDSADAVIARCFNSLLRSKPEEAKGRRADDFVLKPIGLATYIHGPMLFSQFKPIADAVLQRKEMQVDLVDRAAAEEQNSDEISANLYRPTMSLEERLWEYTEVTATFVHSKISVSCVKDPHVFSVWDMKNPFRLRILGVDNFYIPGNPSNNYEINLKAALYEGTTQLGKIHGVTSGKSEQFSSWVAVPPPSALNPATIIYPESKSRIDFSDGVAHLCDLPRATQICFTLSYRTSSSDLEGTPIAWCNIPVFGYNHELVTGQVQQSMWRATREQFERLGQHVNPRGSARPNYMSTQEGLPSLYLQFETYPLPVVFPTSFGESEDLSSPNVRPKSSKMSSLKSSSDKSKRSGSSAASNLPKPRLPRFPAATAMTNKESRKIGQIVSGYPIDVLTPKDKHLLWKTRELLKVGEPRAVSKFLQSIPLNYQARLEAYRVMYLWNVDELDAADFLELLDAKFADPVIRAWAVEKLENLEDDAISDYLLQLIQALRYEPYLDCALTRFLLRRAVASPNLLGHFFFWYLKSELHNVETFERNGLLLEAFLRALTPNQRIQLGLQNQLVNALLDISLKVVKASDKDNKVALLHGELHALNQTLFNNWTLSPPNVTSIVNSQNDSISSASHARQSVSFASFGANRRTISRQNSFQADPVENGAASLPMSSNNRLQGAHSPLSAGIVSPLEGNSPQDLNSLASPPASPRSANGINTGASGATSPPNGTSPNEPSIAVNGSPNSPSSGQLSESSPHTSGHTRVSSHPSLSRTTSSNLLGVPGNGSNCFASGGPVSIKLPLNPLIEVSGFIPSKCKIMKSKKEPLWLCFQNADPKSGPFLAMFKAGDDLRQDMLVLQLFRIMDRLWRSHGLHLDMAIYNVLATGDQCGFVEVVTKSKTISELQGLSFKDEVLFDFILESNGGNSNSTPQSASQAPASIPTAGSLTSKPSSGSLIAKPVSQPAPTLDHPLALAVSRFTRSCAAYCVATYVLGIGDRHNGNVMIREDGTLFHIDFGHVLGNFKEKYGIRRERVPFVFTPEMVYVMGDKNDVFYAQFVEMCTTAYNLLRSSASLFMNLFAMMMSSGMPELQTVEDLFYLKDTLDLDLTQQQAGEKFAAMLESSSKALSTRVNWVIHNIAQRLK